MNCKILGEFRDLLLRAPKISSCTSKKEKLVEIIEIILNLCHLSLLSSIEADDTAVIGLACPASGVDSLD